MSWAIGSVLEVDVAMSFLRSTKKTMTMSRSSTAVVESLGNSCAESPLLDSTPLLFEFSVVDLLSEVKHYRWPTGIRHWQTALRAWRGRRL